MMTHSSQELREAPELWGKSMCRAILRDTRQTNTEPSPWLRKSLVPRESLLE